MTTANSTMLDTIESLFFDTAFSDLSMDEIANALDIKKASLYYHFPSKERMFLDVLNHSYQKYYCAMLDIFTTSESDLVERVIPYGAQHKNLFSVVSQKGYCKIDAVKTSISGYQSELRTDLGNILANRHGWKPERSQLFLVLLESLAKEYCLQGCTEDMDPAIVQEIHRLFF
jgi:AcrR family transcriptional regulator